MNPEPSAPALRSLLSTWVGLVALLALTVGSAYVPMGWMNAVANLGIAAAKAALVMLVFMRLWRADSLIRLFAFGVFFWIVTMVALGLMDFLTQPA